MGTYGYRYNPSYIPQPYFIPGYTGYIPQLNFKLGQTYGQTNHQLIRDDPRLNERLAPMDWKEDLWRRGKTVEAHPVCRTAGCQCGMDHSRPPPCSSGDSKELKPKCTMDKPKEMFLPEHICPSYQGYVSRTSKKVGIPENPCCREVLEEFNLTEEPYDIPIPGEVPMTRGPPEHPMQPFAMPSLRRKDGMWIRYPEYAGSTYPRTLWM